MLKRFILVSILGIALTGYSSAQTILIDNFNQGAGGSTINQTISSNGSDVVFYSGLTSTTIGAQRIARLHHVAGSGTVALNNTINPDVLSMSLPSSSTIQAHFHLYYGYNTFDPSAATPVAGTHSFFDLNADTSALNPQVSFDIFRLDVVPSSLIVTLVSARGTGSEAFRSVTTTFNSSIFSAITVNLTPAQFAAGVGSGTLNWSDIDQVIFQTDDLVDSTDLRLDNFRFSAVPEPTTYALVAGSLLLVGGGAWHRRRKEAKQSNMDLQASV